MTSTISCLKYK